MSPIWQHSQDHDLCRARQIQVARGRGQAYMPAKLGASVLVTYPISSKMVSKLFGRGP